MSLPTLETQQKILQRIRQSQSQKSDHLIKMKERQQEGLKIAQQIAQRLKIEFGVKKVVLFGSLLDPQDMTFDSDIDLAVWGLPSRLLDRAGAVAEKGHNFPVDLIPAEKAKPYIQDAISTGIEL